MREDVFSSCGNSRGKGPVVGRSMVHLRNISKAEISWETLSQNHPAQPLLIPDPRVYEAVNESCFKLQSLGVICYAAREN